MFATLRPASMLDRLGCPVSSSRTPVRAGAVVLAVVLTALAAQFTIPLPFTAVPFTLTPLVVMLTGAALGSRLGFADAGPVSRRRRRRPAVFAPSPTLPPGAAAAHRPDRRLSAGVSDRGVRDRLARRARMGSPLRDVARQHARRPRDHFRRRRLVARDLRHAVAPGRRRHRLRAVRRVRRPQSRRRRADPSRRLEALKRRPR